MNKKCPEELCVVTEVQSAASLLRVQVRSVPTV